MSHEAPPDGEQRSTRSLRRVIALLAVVFVLVGALTVLVVRGLGGTSAPSPTPSQPATSPAANSPGTGPTTGTPTARRSPAASPTPTASTPATSTSLAPTTGRTAGNDPRPPSTRPPVPIRTPAEVQPGLVASIADVEAVEGEAQGPGEVAGPAIRFTLRLRNNGDQELPLATTVVNLYHGRDETPASPLTQPGGVPLPASVAPGAEATGTYLFVVPRDARNRVLITVDYSVDVSLVAFRGSVPA